MSDALLAEIPVLVEDLESLIGRNPTLPAQCQFRVEDIGKEIRTTLEKDGRRAIEHIPVLLDEMCSHALACLQCNGEGFGEVGQKRRRIIEILVKASCEGKDTENVYFFLYRACGWTQTQIIELCFKRKG
ncbi:MAG: hypothetical protein PHV93_02085 [Candidatus Pacebacteria bacterium]|nr:hypothetical protein [Candidatus Paceibacterota bacterium]